jgi:hypothetical protein
VKPKLIEGRICMPDEKFGGYYFLSENDPRYRGILKETLGRMDSERFAQVIEFCYRHKKNGHWKN